MELKVDVGISSICKNGEEVCGDTTRVIKAKDSTTVILSDGLGSGIKASILSILSTRIASRLINEDVELEQVFETIAGTLPICQVRGIAYSTLSILKVKDNGQSHLIEYDNPSLIVIRNSDLLNFKKIQRNIAGKKVYESFFQLKKNDILLLISDGIINAGVDGLFKLGLGQDRLLENIFKNETLEKSSHLIANYIIGLTRACYQDRPGDDSTCAVIKVRDPHNAIILTGPPASPNVDSKVVNRFIDQRDYKQVICGGATGNMAARVLDKELKTSLEYIDPSVPPTASIENIDLVTEGILTLNRAYKILKTESNNEGLYRDINKKDDTGTPEKDAFESENKLKKDGASELVDIFMNADNISFMMGTAINPAHEELMQSLQLKPRPNIVGKIVNILRQMGKNVEIEVF